MASGPPLSTSSSIDLGMPSRSEASSASAIATVASLIQVLTTSFSRLASWRVPTTSTRLPSAFSTGRAASTALLGPATSQLRVPVRAGPVLPETGASSIVRRWVLASARSRSAHSAPTVDACTQTASRRRGGQHAVGDGVDGFPVGHHRDDDGRACDGGSLVVLGPSRRSRRGVARVRECGPRRLPGGRSRPTGRPSPSPCFRSREW